ncbi:putative tyrosine-protein kinase transmembrane receptor ROR2 [Triplophysa rosa]|uniref:Tyrosine-protein kinase transmembrane receptor ROR2 n=1 Tax=Triplophysa rosa TaxID=992332 RepID=A0A9W7T3I4_TRIRA|nr:putative tyrosine-protein kinase transmembrane receptor ROR2 [Triplophysa rosa]
MSSRVPPCTVTCLSDARSPHFRERVPVLELPDLANAFGSVPHEMLWTAFDFFHVPDQDPACQLCAAPANLKHTIVGCKKSLTQGRYTWRHNQVLKSLAAAVETKRMAANAIPQNIKANSLKRQPFSREGQKPWAKPLTPDSGLLSIARDWEMQVVFNQGFTFPLEIAATNLRSDMVLWSSSSRTVLIVELTVPWEEAINEAFERKNLRYAKLAVEAEDRGWTAKVFPVEVGCRGFVSNSTTRLLKKVGIRGQAQRTVVKELATVVRYIVIISAKDGGHQLEYQGCKVLIFPDYMAEVVEQRRSFSAVMRSLRDLIVDHALRIPARLTITHNGNTKMFASPVAAKLYVDKELRQGGEAGQD